MEALLKLIVGVDGVTANMLVQVSYLYVATKVISTVGYVAALLGFTYLVTGTIKWGIERTAKVTEASIAERASRTVR